jgi:hypothetical protein
MLPRATSVIAIAMIAVFLLLGGCHIVLLDSDSDYGAPDPLDNPVTDPDLLAVTSPSGQSYTAGDSLTIVWTGSDQPDYLTIDLYLAGVPHARIAENLANQGRYTWTIPADFSVNTEVFTEYQIVVSGYHPDQSTGSLLLAAFSVEFTILPNASGGLSDVTVSQRLVDVTLTDNGQEIDGDTVDLYLNGSAVALGHVLAGGAGTTFGLTLAAGENVFEVYAVNEGSVSPNTALLEISHVVQGLTTQQWRLAAGEYGRLTITAP